MIKPITLQQVVEAHPGVEAIENAETLVEYANALVNEFMRSNSGTYTVETRVNAIAKQVKYWRANGINPETVETEASQQVASASLNGGSVSYAGADDVQKARVKSATTLCYTAREVLRDALFGRIAPVITIG